MSNLSNTAKPVQQTSVRKTEAFVGITKREYERLKSVQPLAFKIYVGLRWLANFKTGRIGDDPKHPVNDDILCDSLGQSAPGIVLALGELAQSGLVADFVNANGSVKMLLPFAAETSVRSTIGTSKIQLPPFVDKSEPISGATLTSSKSHGNQYCSTSTDQNLINLSSTDLGHNPKTSPAPLKINSNPERADSLDQGGKAIKCHQGENNTPRAVSVASKIDGLDDFDDWDFDSPIPIDIKKQTLEEKLQTEQHLTVQELKQYLSSLNFLYVSGAISEGLYPRIVNSYTALEITHAAQAVCSDPAIQPAPLRLSEALAKNKQVKRSGRGRVAL